MSCGVVVAPLRISNPLARHIEQRRPLFGREPVRGLRFRAEFWKKGEVFQPSLPLCVFQDETHKPDVHTQCLIADLARVATPQTQGLQRIHVDIGQELVIEERTQHIPAVLVVADLSFIAAADWEQGLFVVLDERGRCRREGATRRRDSLLHAFPECEEPPFRVGLSFGQVLGACGLLNEMVLKAGTCVPLWGEFGTTFKIETTIERGMSVRGLLLPFRYGGSHEEDDKLFE